MAIKNTLRNLRFEFRMEQNDFAEFLGANRTQYNKWELQKGQPSLEWAMVIAKRTEKPIEYFIQLVEE